MAHLLLEPCCRLIVNGLFTQVTGLNRQGIERSRVVALEGRLGYVSASSGDRSFRPKVFR